MAIVNRETLTPREYEEMNYQKEILEKQQQHAIRMKELEIEVEKVGARFNSWFKLPVELLRLPVRILFGLAFIVAVARNRDDLDDFWDVLR